jgi:hypothetical protein
MPASSGTIGGETMWYSTSNRGMVDDVHGGVLIGMCAEELTSQKPLADRKSDDPNGCRDVAAGQVQAQSPQDTLVLIKSGGAGVGGAVLDGPSDMPSGSAAAM